jgi:VIT1/CCC1 family predicted Fe2+/Mn2+ transporter
MSPAPSEPKLIRRMISAQTAEITEYTIYSKLASVTTDAHNREVLSRIAAEELDHYAIWKRYTERDVSPDSARIWLFYCAARLLGITFTLKLMERVEKRAQAPDPLLASAIPEIPAILANEEMHERELIALIDEERLRYMGSMVLGLNDAIVEFTGMLAGLTFALQNSQIIAVASLVTGIAAALSMGSSEYLSQKSELTVPDPLRAAFYTSAAYLITVALLISPFLLLGNPYSAIVCTLAGAGGVIFIFTYYISVAKDLPFRSRFTEMLAISFGIAAISFILGLAIRVVLNVSV